MINTEQQESSSMWQKYIPKIVNKAESAIVNSEMSTDIDVGTALAICALKRCMWYYNGEKEKNIT